MVDASDGFMGISVFQGGNGHLVLMQEFPRQDGERYVRIITDMSNAEQLCAEILAVAKKARGK